MLKARFQVVKGDFKDRLIFENYLLEHENSKVTDINLRKLQDLAKAAGDNNNYESIGDVVANIGDYTEIPIMASIGIRDPFVNAKGETKLDNKINKLSAR